MKKSWIIITLLASSMAAQAQRCITVYDPERNEPVRDALVWVDHKEAEASTILGEAFIPERFDTLHISATGYVSLAIPASLTADSIPLMQDYSNIGEIVVHGVYRNNQLTESVKRWTKEARKEFELRNPIRGINFSMADTVDPRLRRIKKQTKNWRRSLSGWMQRAPTPSYKPTEKPSERTRKRVTRNRRSALSSSIEPY